MLHFPSKSSRGVALLCSCGAPQSPMMSAWCISYCYWFSRSSANDLRLLAWLQVAHAERGGHLRSASCRRETDFKEVKTAREIKDENDNGTCVSKAATIGYNFAVQHLFLACERIGNAGFSNLGKFEKPACSNGWARQESVEQANPCLSTVTFQLLARRANGWLKHSDRCFGRRPKDTRTCRH